MQLKKKYLFKRTPFAEAKERYMDLLADSKRKVSDYSAQCLLALARCEEGLKAEDAEIRNLSTILRNKEIVRRRTEYARFFFASNEPTIIFLHATYCASSSPFSSLPFGQSPIISFSPFPAIPVHQFLPLSQLPAAIQSYLVGISIYKSHNKANMAASLEYEMATQMQRTGDLSSAAIHWNELPKDLLLQSVNLPSKNLSTSSATIQKFVKRKASSRAPLTAYCAFQRSFIANVRSGQYKRATKTAVQMVDLMIEEKESIPGGAEKIIEALISLLLMYTIRCDFSKAHKVLQRISYKLGKGPSQEAAWNISMSGSCDLTVLLLDLIESYDERDMDCVEEISLELFPLLTCIQQEVLLILLEQSKGY